MSNTIQDCNVIPYEFGKKLFPSLVDGKLNTLEFLEASKGVAGLISNLGTVFAPLYNDIYSNIEKIKQCHSRDPGACASIEELIMSESLTIKDVTIDALLWLQRALHFTLIFFQNILNDEEKFESLDSHMSSAYSQTLEPYHGWITRQLFKFFKNLMPKRSDLLLKISGNNNSWTESEQDKMEEIERVLRSLDVYFQGLSKNIYHIKSLLESLNLNKTTKV